MLPSFRLIAILAACCSLAGWSQAPVGGTYTNPVIPGEHPDPSVIRVQQEYWATSTSGQWEPEFPLFHSRDLVNWEQVGTIFKKPPEWAASDFWAPEISEHKGKYYVFYTARKRNGPLCVASASAASPLGPYNDNGPLVCQELGSIDGFPAVSENGERYLIWKEDGNSRNRPTPIWAQRMSEDGRSLMDKPVELIRNDRPWESKVVEGAFILRRGEYFYMLYSGAACCGLECNYGVGVARAKRLLGPWEKFPGNPIVKSGAHWKCPGHGSVVADTHGRNFFLFHSYRAGAFDLGRQAVLQEITWRDDGWPRLRDGAEVSDVSQLPSAARQEIATGFLDDFSGETLGPGWEWPIGEAPLFHTRSEHGKGLTLQAANTVRSGMMSGILARRTTTPDYVATTAARTEPRAGASLAGLAAFGGHEDAAGVAVSGREAVLWQKRAGRENILARIATHVAPVHLRVIARKNRLRFEVSEDGVQWKRFKLRGQDELSVENWDGSVRLALFTSEKSRAQFEYFKVSALQPTNSKEQ